VAKFKIATPAGASFTVEGGGYDYEMEALQGMDAEIVEGPTDEDGFIKFAQDADAVYAKGIRITKKIIDGLPAKCRAIVLGRSELTVSMSSRRRLAAYRLRTVRTRSSRKSRTTR
jgi:D-3-phosphoglycerate dehydrogenase